MYPLEVSASRRSTYALPSAGQGPVDSVKKRNKFSACDDQQALVSCLPGKGVGGTLNLQRIQPPTLLQRLVQLMLLSIVVNCILNPLRLNDVLTRVHSTSESRKASILHWSGPHSQNLNYS